MAESFLLFIYFIIRVMIYGYTRLSEFREENRTGNSK